MAQMNKREEDEFISDLEERLAKKEITKEKAIEVINSFMSLFTNRDFSQLKAFRNKLME